MTTDALTGGFLCGPRTATTKILGGADTYLL